MMHGQKNIKLLKFLLLLLSVIIPPVRLKLRGSLLHYFLCSLWYAEGWEAALVGRRYKFIRSPLRAYWCLTDNHGNLKIVLT
jgi:hypothetical protein